MPEGSGFPKLNMLCILRTRIHNTMTRVQVLLPEDQDRRIEALAAKRRESKGKLIRHALDLLLRAESAKEEPLLSLIGQSGHSHRRDASDHHDRLLVDSERARNRRR